jgi:hypothetical protein
VWDNRGVKKMSLGFVGFLQAIGIVMYCGIVGLIPMYGNKWFGSGPMFFGPAIFLALFSVSAVICGLIFLGYPFWLFWEHKQTKNALKLVIYSSAWLLGLVICGFGIMAFYKGF